MARMQATIPSKFVSAIHEALKDLDCPPEYYKRMLKSVILYPYFYCHMRILPATEFRRRNQYRENNFWKLNEQDKAIYLKKLRKVVQERILTEEFKKTGHWGEDSPSFDYFIDTKDLWESFDKRITPPRCKTYTRCIDELKI